MMLANKIDVQKILRTGENGLILGDFSSDAAIKVTYVSNRTDDAPTSAGVVDFHFVVKYEMTMLDCRGTDQCSGTYVWTVPEEVTGDGCMYQTSFTNQLKKK